MLARGDPAHPVGALRVVAEGHVLADSEHSHGVGHVFDVGAGCVHLVVEAEAPLERDQRVLELD